MPDPRALRIGDRIRFVALPDEWSAPNYTIQEEDIEFMRQMIKRRWPSRIGRMDEYGTPWISARIKAKSGYEYHEWAVMESTGWRKVRQRGE